MYLILNDIHFGMYKNNEAMHSSLMRMFIHGILPRVASGDYKGIFILGDLLQSKVTLLNRISIDMDAIIARMAEYCKVYILVGNHDLIYDHDYRTHSLKRFEFFDNVEVLLGGGKLEIDGKTIYYHSYDNSSTIADWLESNDISGDLFLGHLEMDGHRVIKHINNNFTLGLSGHVHNIEKHNNFIYCPSLQENTFSEMNNEKGYVELDLDNMKYTRCNNMLSGKFKKIKYGVDEINEANISNNYLDIEVDLTLIRKKSSTKNGQTKVLSEYFDEINKLKPAYIVRQNIIDSEDGTKDEIEMTHDISEVRELNFNNSIVELLSLLDISEFKEETISEISTYLKETGKI